MAEQSSDSQRVRRLNPFLFPPDTDLRFVLLIVAVVSASLFLFGVGYNAIFLSQETLALMLDCLAQTPSIRPERPGLSTSPLERLGNLASTFSNWNASIRARKECLEGWELGQGIIAIGGAMLVMAAAFAVYWLMPALKRRRQWLVPLTADHAPEALACLNQLCEEAGLRAKPDFVWNPLDGRVSGLALGHARRKIIALSGGLVALHYSDPATFRAVVLHELAHLRNGDVDKTYLSLAVWPAFVLIVLFPFIVLQLIANPSGDDLAFLAQLAWRIVVLALLIVLLRNAILRTRELYADVRASVWDGPAGALRAVLTQFANVRPRSFAHDIQTLFRKHPSGARRITSLEDTRALFATSAWDAFATGLAAALAFTSMFWLATDVLPVAIEIFAGTVALLLLSPLVAGVICLAVWRDVFADARGCAIHLPYLKFASALVAGMIVGRWLGATSAIQDDLFGSATSPLDALMFFAWWELWLAVGLYLFMLAVAETARAWMGVARDAHRLARLARLSLVVAAISMTLWLGVAFAFSSMSDFPSLAIAKFTLSLLSLGSPFIVVWGSAGGWINLALFIAMWALPLVAGWRSRQHSTDGADERWAYLDDSTSTTIELPPHPVQFRVAYAIRAGVVAGFVYLLIIIALRYVLRLSMDETTLSSDDTKLALMMGIVVVSAIVQALIALCVAARVRELKLSHGLLAAFAAGVTIALGFLITNVVLFEGSLNTPFLQTVLLWVVNTGAWLALPLLGAAIGIARRRQHTLASPGLSAQPGAPAA